MCIYSIIYTVYLALYIVYISIMYILAFYYSTNILPKCSSEFLRKEN